MDYLQAYEKWLKHPLIDEATKEELEALRGNEKEIEDRFYRSLEFGTGGMRGVIGAGTNRMNTYVIQMASQGFANYINGSQSGPKAIVIAHDSRRKSKTFAKAAALVMSANGILAYLFEDIRTTPELSFAVRELGASAGIVITASHNPPEYNGYKIYGSDGCQLLPEFADKVIEAVEKVSDPSMVKTFSEEEAILLDMLRYVDYQVDLSYMKGVKAKLRQPEIFKAMRDTAIVYTPLHGTGGRPITVIAKELGYRGLVECMEQMIPNGEFPTVSYPNPEEEKAFELGIEYALKTDAIAVIATDPDCDRVGVMVKNEAGSFVKLTGNQTGALLIDYLFAHTNPLPKNPVVIDTIVSSRFGADVARASGAEVMSTLTGFKFIGDKIRQFEDGSKDFFLGYEESYGYLVGTDVRDKDAVISSLLIMEMILFYKQSGKGLLDRLEELYQIHGYYLEDLVSLSRSGKEGMAQIAAMMENSRTTSEVSVGGIAIERCIDYAKDETGLPKSDVLKFILADGSWFAVRPSGTEPKLKVYIGVKSDCMEDSTKKIAQLKQEILEKILKA